MSELALSDPGLPATPWTGRANKIASLAAAVSLVGVVGAWNGISHQSSFDDAQPWFFLGVMALLLGLADAVLWLSGAARRIRGVRLESHEILRREFGIGPVAAVPVAQRAPRYVRAAGMVKVHLDSCELIAGKDCDEVPVGPDAERCGMCLP
jgi:hypothetical protein